jgi:hypothetical protein
MTALPKLDDMHELEISNEVDEVFGLIPFEDTIEAANKKILAKARHWQAIEKWAKGAAQFIEGQSEYPAAAWLLEARKLGIIT